MPPETGPGPDFLKNKYDLHNAPEVERSADFVARETEKKLNSPQEKIEAYLGRLEGFFTDPDPKKRERKIHFLKTKLFDLLVTKPEDVPASYDQFIIQTLEEQGQRGDWDNASDEQKQELRTQNIEGMISDQKESLELWVDYLGSEDAMYPNWLKYWAFRSIANLQEYEKPEIDKETGKEKSKGRFPKRSRGTLKMFPDLNHEALSYVLDTVEQKFQGQSPEFPYDIQEGERARFQQFLNNENFANLYAWAIENINPIDEALLQTTEGRWIKYDRNSSPESLVQSIRGKGTGWCTAGATTAKKQLELGDFYVFYSQDQENNPTIPRLAIRMQQNKIAEVRGIAKKQNLDPFIGEVLAQKLEEFPDKAEFLQKQQDMAKLTELKNKTLKGEALNKDDLIFLYEIDHKIQGFGYVDDPRIKEIRNQRNPREDAPVVLECEPQEIAWSQSEINDNTKSYIGPLFPNIFLLNLEHIYTSFPETEVKQDDLRVGGATAPELQGKLDKLCRRATGEINISDSAQDKLKEIYQTPEFVRFTQNPEIIRTVRLKVRDLGFTTNPTTDQIYARVQELGLELCPDEVGPYQRLKDVDQPMDTWYSIAMKQFAGRDGSPHVFNLAHDVDGLYLRSYWADPTRKWNLDSGFMFRLPQVSQES